MKKLQPRIADIAEDAIAALTAAGPGTDLVREFAFPVPALVICEMLGVPPGDRDRFQRTSTAMFDQTTPLHDPHPHGHTADTAADAIRLCPSGAITTTEHH